MINRIVAAAALVPAVLGATAGSVPAQAAPRTTAVVTLTYDASGAGKWADAIKKAAENWNTAEHNVHLQPATSAGSADFVYKATSGWPQSTLGPIFPGGSGEVQLGEEAVTEGYDLARVVTHETGHILGLPDDYDGPCSEIMSGHGPGPSCTNDKPDATESAQVDQNYARGASAARLKARHVVVDVWRDAPAFATTR
ncbi:snapalysin family zinc-dependent metalloprotease [Streptomyces catenulae]|uniref:Extracellular small neutral protease n=1 Tax=Streptomyces catenulae TaxID=66875 RepID=A0ABV2YSQ0_9ACTN|nr:snapalysin family zinc-dependent metalloprotease [Streptomyces catenulae]